MDGRKAIARSGLGKAIAFKNGQASKLPMHSWELARDDRPSGHWSLVISQSGFREAIASLELIYKVKIKTRFEG